MINIYKPLRLVLVLLSVGVMSLTIYSSQVSASKSDIPGNGWWWSSFTLQNISETATVSITLLESGFSISANVNCPILPGASVTYNPGFEPNYKADGTGGTRIGFATNCEDGSFMHPLSNYHTQQNGSLTGVVSVGNNKNGTVGIDDGQASAFYQASLHGSNTLLFPVVKNNFGGQSTTLLIMALQDASITIRYNDGDVDGPESVSAKHTYIVSSPWSLPSDRSYSAIVESSSGLIAGTFFEYSSNANPATFALASRAFTADDADTTVYAPSLKNDFYGGTTGMAVQAIGGPVTVVVDFAIINSAPNSNCANGTSEAVDLQDGESVIFGGTRDHYLPVEFGNGCFASATVRVVAGIGKIVATVNETNTSGKSVYSAFPAHAASTQFSLPVVKEAFAGGATSVVVQAIGNGSTEVTATYFNNGACKDGCTVHPNGGGAGNSTISGGSANNFRRLNDFAAQYTGTLPSIGTNNAVLITSTSLPVVAIAQETTPGLDVKNYEGFGTGSTELFMP